MCVDQHQRGRSPPARPPLLLLLFLSSSCLGAISIPKNLLQPPVLTELPKSLTAFSLDDVTLPCEATGTPTPSFRWTRDGLELKTKYEGSGTFTPHDDKPLSSYQGNYRCYANNDLGTAMTHTIRLITELTPTLPKQKRIRLKVDEGAHVVLHCNPPQSSTPPEIHWMDRKLNHIMQSERVIRGLDGNLYFANVLKGDSRDDYTCNAHYSEARTILPKEPISLTVISSNDEVRGRKPQLMQPQGQHSSHLALRGHHLVLECIPRGLPTPLVKWRHKDVALAESGAEEKHHGRWLEFKSITQKADGEYECVSSNTHGSIKHSYTVTVEAEPYWVKEPQSLLYAPGETVRLDCQAEGVPTPTVTWSMNGEPIKDLDSDFRRNVSRGVLILTDVTFTDTAVYQCEATNRHGTILINTFIYVIELPAQILSSDGVVYRITEGGVVRMHCDAFGSPRPQVTWDTADPQNVLLSDSRVSQLTNGTIELFNASREDVGIYTCSITQSNISITAHLEVLNRTVMLIGPQDVKVKRGGDSWLDCYVSHDLQINHLKITWKKDNLNIVESSPDDKYTIFKNGTLRVTDIHSGDGGRYSCEVITELDRVSASGSITVVARPDPPTSVSLSDLTDQRHQLRWTPGHTHNSPTTEFVVEMWEKKNSSETVKWEEFRRVNGDIHHLELSLLPDLTYQFRVSGVNDLGKSNPSEPSESYRHPPAVPDRNPEDVRSVSNETGKLLITWKEMDDRYFYGSGFLYKVSWRQAHGREPHWHHAFVRKPPHSVNGVGTFSSYDIKVQAVNSLGEGPHPITKTGHSGEDKPLDSVSNISISVVNNSAKVRWQPVDPHMVQGHLLGHKIYVKRLGSKRGRQRRAMEWREEKDREGGVERGTEREEDRRVLVVNGSMTEVELTGLTLYSVYELSITVFNSMGEGPHSPKHSFSTPEGAPGPPASLDFESPSETELILRWTPPTQPNGQILEYILQYQQISESGDSPLKILMIPDWAVTQILVAGLEPHSSYVFYLSGRTAAGRGPAIKREGATLLDGVPPSDISTVPGETSVNLSWVPEKRHRNHGFHIRYLPKTGGSRWEESEQVNSTQGFYSLTGLQAGTEYHLLITHNNKTKWETRILTTGPDRTDLVGDFATQGWFIGLISAVVLLMLLLLILCFIKRSRGGKYAVKDKEVGQADSDVRPIKDETFGEYRSLESDGEEKRSGSQPSLCVESKLGSDDSLAEYGDSVDIQFNEDGSFIGQYSGRGPVPTGNESSGPTSPVNQDPPPPPIGPSFSGILNRPSKI
ncbi:neural cell adhesion molecule L1.1 isoform X3 [Esox lucius]|uniref:neural cell adhesion molecule L1.1 isoform X3 n=1 Tax=Esox lucius TaxID=8010 RepID=UPI001476FCF7|nr:neural cell adhesion molecule L1.1 isoform X3 [Esox lucius]